MEFSFHIKSFINNSFTITLYITFTVQEEAVYFIYMQQATRST
jgi:hypothetical protein